MEYRILTGTGMTVSRLSLGTMTFGAQADEATSDRMVRMALDAGINFVDTADVYTRGRSEEITGRAIKGVRDQVILATKIGSPTGRAPRDAGLHRHHIIKGVEQQLHRLQTDYVDVYYMHRPDPNTPMEETLAAFETLAQQGKIRYLGMSNHASWQIGEAKWIADALRDFARIWTAMTPENQGRLLRALVAAVRVKKESGVVEVKLVNFAADPSAKEAA